MTNYFYAKLIESKFDGATNDFLEDLLEFVDTHGSSICTKFPYQLNLLRSPNKNFIHEIKQHYYVNLKSIDTTSMTVSMLIDDYEVQQKSIFCELTKKMKKDYGLVASSIFELKKMYSQELKSFILSNCKGRFHQICSVKNSSLWKKIFQLCYYKEIEKFDFLFVYNCVKQNYYEYIMDWKKSKFLLSSGVKDPIVKEVFEYFYTELLTQKNFTNIYCNNQDLKKMYKEKVAEEVICPCCGIKIFEGHFDVDIDHFLPQASYPYLSIFSENLLGCCISCNERIKKAKFRLPIAHPRRLLIYENLNFSYSIFREQQVKIKIDNDSEYYTAIQNYIYVYDILDRFNKKNFIKQLNSIIVKDSSYINISKADTKKLGKFLLDNYASTEIDCNNLQSKLILSFYENVAKHENCEQARMIKKFCS